MPYDQATLRRVLAASWINEIDYRELVGSTNDLALRRAIDATIEPPLLVLADRQLAGRGRGANQWWSPHGALTFSIVTEAVDTLNDRGVPPATAIQEKPPPKHAAMGPACRVPLVNSASRHTVSPLIALAAGLSVCEALTQIHPPLHIGLKWPNDVLVDDRKIGGILVEVAQQAPSRVVIGIGVNVNNSLANADPQLQQTAIALVDVTQYTVPLVDVLVRVVDQLGALLREMNDDASQLIARWQTHCVLTGRHVRLRSGQQVHSGICRGISSQGALQIETAQGVRSFSSGTVTGVDV